MTPERWQQINQVFHAALQREGPARRSYVETATAGDAELRREVESLLAASEGAAGFLDTPAYGVAPELMFDEADSLAGRRVGTYQVLEEIGRGGMGVVYAAEDQRLGRRVALKALAPEYTRDPKRRERLTREARAAALLSHPAIATIFALEEIDGDLYIVSELVRGRTLRRELAEGALPAELLMTTLIDIASAMCVAHREGIVHRDLKPENILRREDGQIKILDFGLAQVDSGRRATTFVRLTETGMALGTPGYMAPEQLSGGTIDARTDIFAFGVIAWELATGEHPFGADPGALLARMTELLEGRASVSSRPLPVAGLDRIARQCMRGRPEDRYQDAETLLSDLRAAEATLRRTGVQPVYPPPKGPLWWWQFHQMTMAVVHAAMPVAAWLTRKDVGSPWGSRMFFATLILATISVTIRLNLYFMARVQPGSLAEHRARVFPALLAAELLLVTVLLTAAVFVGEEFAAVIVIVAIASLASLLLIEPATTRAAGLDHGPSRTRSTPKHP